MKYENVADQLGDWGNKLKPFIESSEFDDIFAFLKKESVEEKKVICPQHKDVFRSFRETPYNNLRCIFILQDPYPWIKGGKYVADGIPMSSTYTNICQPSLEKFYEGMEDDLGRSVPRIADLSYLSRQGILFLNSSLTVELNKPGSHASLGLWDKFIKYLIEDVINYYNRGLIYVSLGANAHIVAKAVVPFLHWGFELEHPANAARRERVWKHDKIFTKINKILKDCNDEQINWAYGDVRDTTFSQRIKEVRKGVGGKVRKD